MKLIDWFFYMIGVMFIGSLGHELYHFANCGGSFLAGFGYFDGYPYVAATWCEVKNGAGGELLPTTLEILFFTAMFYLKWRKARA